VNESPAKTKLLMVSSYKLNSRMLGLLGWVEGDPRRASGTVPPELTRDLQGGFEEFQGCVLWRDPTRTVFDLGDGEDRTGIECLFNKTHIEVDASSASSLRKSLKDGIAYAFAVEEALAQSGLRGPFRIILGADLTGEFPSVTVRHHRVREGETWIAQDLEKYDDAVLVVNVP
jgi:hypothetical protein